MFKKISEFFTGKKPEAAPEAPYKVDPIPAGTEASVIATTAPEVEAVVVVADAVVPAEVVKAAPAKKAPAKPKAVKPAVVKATPAPKKPRAPKAK
jgi:hypothetical protein